MPINTTTQEMFPKGMQNGKKIASAGNRLFFISGVPDSWKKTQLTPGAHRNWVHVLDFSELLATMDFTTKPPTPFVC
jgi:hypothetical protein